MFELTIGEKIMLAERELKDLEKEFGFCDKIIKGKINVKEHFAFLLVPVCFEGYKWDEDEEYYFEEAKLERDISKEDFIEERKAEIRSSALNLYHKKVGEYANVKEKALALKEKITVEKNTIKVAIRKHRASYIKAKYLSQRMYSPSFNFCLIGDAMAESVMCGIEGKQPPLTAIEKLKLDM